MKQYEYTSHVEQKLKLPIEALSLCVAYRTKDGGIIRVITFYPNSKGRYERKVLQRG